MVKVDLTGAAEFFCSGGPDYARAAEAHRVWLTVPVRAANLQAGEAWRS
jgi:hypothetical protein